MRTCVVSLRNRQLRAAPIALLLAMVASSATAHAQNVVNNPRPDTVNFTFRISQQPLLKLGGLNNDERYELVGFADATVASNGHVYVIPVEGSNSSCGSEVRVFDGSGTFVRRFGRSGQGPGEYSCLSNLVLLGNDTIMAQDGRSRMTLLDVRGTVLGTKELTRGTNLCCFRDGGFITSPNYLSAQLGGRGSNRPPVVFTAFRVTGDTAGKPSATVPAGDTALRIPFSRSGGAGGRLAGSGFWAPPFPYARSAYVAIAGDQIIHGVGDAYEYKVYSKQGALIRTVRAALPPRPVTRADIDAWNEDLLNVSRGFNAESQFRSISASMRFPQTMPAYSNILADQDGNVWVRNYIARDETSANYWWARFDRNGTLLGTLKHPADRTVVRFQGDIVLLRQRDTTSGTAMLYLHRVERSPR